MSAELLDVGIAVGSLLVGLVAGAVGHRRITNNDNGLRVSSLCPAHSGIDERLKAIKADVDTMKTQLNAIHQKVCL